ncbi:MAG TPA: trypsin-like peptidase domain-containing protein [Gemmataceae bacterium]|nr:trypsin-like peptidase domain-containing protein [Gemmataceae bacterium]
MRFCRPLALLGALLWAGLAAADPAAKSIPEPPAAVSKAAPESIDDLKAFQEQTRAVLDKVIPATVCLRVGQASGSGVIVSKDGLILTAGHVSGEPGKKIKVVLHDGKTVEGETLGFGPAIDSGMVKITGGGEWPYVEVGAAKDLKPGQWVIATGHPGGYKKGRSPVVRVGRVGLRSDTVVQTDCTLVGGDSGGPLFDMTGKVVGIHSRIGMPIVANIHVPSDTYKETWDDLVKGEIVGVSPYFGVTQDDMAKDCKLAAVTPRSPAADAGLKAGDVITKFAGKDVASYDDMVKVLQAQKPLAQVPVEVLRGDEVKELKVKIGWRRK